MVETLYLRRRYAVPHNPGRTARPPQPERTRMTRLPLGAGLACCDRAAGGTGRPA